MANFTTKNAADTDITIAATDIAEVLYPHNVPHTVDGVELAKAEDAAHTSGDKGIMAMAVRNDTPSALAGTDADYIPLTTDSQGKLYVLSAPRVISVSQTFTPAASSHTALDSVGGSRTFSAVGWSGKNVEIVQVIFTAPTTTPIATAFKLWLYSAAIATPISDDGAFAPVSADESLFLGVIDIPTPLDPGSTLQTITVPGSWRIQPSGTDVIAYLQNLTTFTFEAIAHTIRLTCVQGG